MASTIIIWFICPKHRAGQAEAVSFRDSGSIDGIGIPFIPFRIRCFN